MISTPSRKTGLTRRRLFTAVAAVFVTPVVVSAAPYDVMISSGQLSANEHEAHDGYFAIAQSTMVMVKQDTPGHLHLKELARKEAKVDLIVRVIE